MSYKYLKIINDFKILFEYFGKKGRVSIFVVLKFFTRGVAGRKEAKRVYCGVMKSWQTCPLVSGVKITEQTMCSAGSAKSGTDRG
jgi:predicted acetyltransferase